MLCVELKNNEFFKKYFLNNLINMKNKQKAGHFYNT